MGARSSELRVREIGRRLSLKCIEVSDGQDRTRVDSDSVRRERTVRGLDDHLDTLDSVDTARTLDPVLHAWHWVASTPRDRGQAMPVVFARSAHGRVDDAR